MSVTFTASEVGDRLARSHPERGAAFYTRQVRGWAQAGIFPSGQERIGDGDNAAIRYTEVDLLAARVFTHLGAIGIPWSRLGDVADTFWNLSADTAKALPKANRSRGGIGFVVEHLKAGEPGWRLRLRLDENGEVVAGCWCRGDDTTHPAWRGAATLTIEVSRIAVGLFDRITADGEGA